MTLTEVHEAADRIRVLHVDDDPAIGELVEAFLERENDRFEVQTMTDVADAENALADRNVDCVVSDYDMPDRNGLQFLEAVRQEYPDLPFILYTGKGSEEVASEAISAGVTDYLQKGGGPDQYAVLANRITNAVEHRRSQQALSEQNRELRSYERMVNSMRETACIYDTDERFKIVNDALVEWYGMSRDELIGKRSRLIPHIRSEADGDTDPFQELLNGERAEFRGVTATDFPDQGHTIMDYRLTPLKVDGSIEGVVGVARHITDRKERERELHQIERRYQAVFNDPQLLTGLLATDGTVLDINETAMEYVDASPNDVRGVPFWETPWFDNSPDVQQSVREWIDRAAGGEYVSFEADLVRPDGDPYTVEGVFRPVTNDDGEVVSLLVSERDITERKERQRELKQYEAYLQESTDIITVLDDQGVIKYESPSVSRILGYEPGELTGQNGFDYIHPDDVDSLFETFNNLLSNPDETVTVECRFRTASGEWRWLEVHGTNQFDHDAIEGIVTNNRDITERKQREQQLKEQNERLEEFASVVSHDLRNPLTVAQGRLALVREECDSDHLDDIEQAHQRMDTLIEDLLELARDGMSPSEATAVDLADFVRNCWQNVETEAATLVVDTDLAVVADESRLRQLFENLIRNSVEHGSTGSRTGSDDAVEHGGDEVTVTVGEHDSGFYVEDDGPGIPEDDRETVFDAGYSTSTQGTGFGLHIVDQVAEAHGWTVRVTEGSEGGARFEITGVDADAP
ncbi:PAS domain S-box protein [Haloarcula sp. S1AR25-5A]|uniref:histidine kinase n=1 Tax=Haloarcula terrestris TaxID=2950533 RepID=A0AAE4EXU8_9EURY|nr:PAS domain S-box protein [Haloarcula terrestris]MDS0222250.1 PAS domain S-box protein [Haloarcula terrestris]